MAALDLTGNHGGHGPVWGVPWGRACMAPCTLDTGFSWAEKEAHLYLPAPITVVLLPLHPHPPLHCDTLSPWPSGSLLVQHMDPLSSSLLL